MLNPPPEKLAAISGIWAVPPTTVTLYATVITNVTGRGEASLAYKGHVAGKAGMNLVAFFPSFVKQVCVAGLGSPSPTPLSPELNNRETPRAPVDLL